MNRILIALLLFCQSAIGQLLYQDVGEYARYFPISGTFANKISGIENCNNRDTAYAGGLYNWTLSRSLDTSYQGRASMRFQVYNCYALPYVAGSPINSALLVGGSQRVRSEVRIIERGNTVPGFSKEMWYSEVIYFPAYGMPQDSLSDETYNQWFEDGGNDCLLRGRNRRAWAEIGPTARRYDLFGAVGAPSTLSQTTAANTFVKYNFNQWYQFVFHYIWDGGSAGLCEIWRDGVKIQTINGATLHTATYPNWKIGIYKAGYTAHPGQSTAAIRTMFVDNIRLGDSTATYAIMASTGPIVNAGIDKTITLPTTTTTLTGIVTDANGTITSYAWTKLSGPAGGNITSPSLISTGITALQAGIYQYQLTATDNNGAIGSDVIQVTVVANPPPVANAGPDQIITLPTSSVVLSGSGTDVGGSIAAYAWTKVSGPSGGTITSPALASTSITGLLQGVYVYRLTVTDNTGLTGTDIVQITVNQAPNILPNCNAGPDQTITLPTNSVTLTGVGSTDPDGTLTAYLWTKISGPTGGTITSSTSVTTTATGMVQGTYVYQLTVTDDRGGTSNDLVTITVNQAVNTPPIANAGPDQIITLPTNIATLSGSGNDPDGSITNFAWVKISGPTGGFISSPGSAITGITGLVAGTYVYQLTVTDNRGGTATDAVQIIVNPAPNQPPTANAGVDQSITLPTSTTTLIGSGNDPDGSITAYAWVKVSGPAGGTITSPTLATTGITALQAGTYVYRLTVTDNSSATGSDLMQVVVNPAPNVPPTADAGIDQSITLPTNTTTLVGSGNDPDGTITAYVWVKVSGPAGGNITSPTLATTGITSLAAGTYVFRLTVTDNSGATAIDAMQVVVSPAPNVPPVSDAGPDQTITLPASTATLDGSGSSDPDGTIAAYLWAKVSGPTGGAITTPTTVTTGLTGLTQGIYVYSLRVTDNLGATNSDFVTIQVDPAIPPPNIPPVADAGSNQTITLPVNTATLDGSGSTDPDGTIVSYLWIKASGPATGSITSPSSVSTGLTALVAGTYIFQLTVTDNNGDTGTASVQVLVLPCVRVNPNVDAGIDQSITLPTNTTTLVGTASANNCASITSTVWSKVLGSPSGGTITSSSTLTTGITGLIAGTYIFKLTVTDNNGDVSSDVVQVLVNPCARVAPTVSAGTYQTIQLPISTTTLTGTATANNCASISTTLWSKVSGPTGGTITTPSSLSTGVTALQAGTYIFKLLATDNNGDTASNVMQVLVLAAPNVPPTAIPGSNKTITLPTNSVTLTGSGTDTDGTIIGYLWSQVSGPNTATITTPTSATTTVTGLIAGTYILRLTVTDNNSDTGSAVIQVLVNPPANVRPIAYAGPNQTITLPINSVVLLGTGSYDPDGTIVSYLWTKSSGPASGTISTPTFIITDVMGMVEGVYVFRLMVTDNSGDTATASMQVIVSPAVLIRPTANAGVDKSIILPVSSTSATGSGTAPSGTITGYAWTQTSGPNTATISAPTSATTNFTGLIEGTYIMQFKVYDSNGDSATDVMQIVVNPSVNVPPVVDIVTSDTAILLPDNSLTLSATATDPDGSITSILWIKVYGSNTYTITDGTTLTPTISNLQAGNYIFRIIVTDDNGEMTTADITVSIVPNTPAGRKWFRNWWKVFIYPPT